MDIEENKDISSLDLISNLTFCIFDLETTGGNQKHDKIIEIGLVKVVNLKKTEKLNFLIDPQIHIPEFIQKLTHISNKDVKGKPKIEEKIEEILTFMGDSILVAHNTSFDIPFFNSVLRRQNRPELSNKSLCTNLMTKYLVPNLLNSNLTYMSKIFGINLGTAHRALADAEAAGELLLKFLKIFISKDIKKINHLYYPRNRYELDRTHFKKGIHSNKEIIQFIKKNNYNSLLTIKGDNGVILFSFPLEKGDINELIEDKINSSQWETITIKIYGHIVEAALNFNQFFIKFNQDEKQVLQEKILKVSLNSESKSFEYSSELEIINNFDDFIIIPHLVPEQFLIISSTNLSLKNILIFRFPSHKKRLIQYISNRSSRLNNSKYKTENLHPLYKQIIYNLMYKHKKNGTLFSFSSNAPVKAPEQFLKDLLAFTLKNEVSHGYPQNYI